MEKKRVHLRQDFNETVAFVRTDGKKVAGIAQDMSFGGLFFIPTDVADRDLMIMNTEGRIHIGIGDDMIDLPCFVVHVGDDGFGLEIKRLHPPPDIPSMTVTK